MSEKRSSGLASPLRYIESITVSTKVPTGWGPALTRPTAVRTVWGCDVALAVMCCTASCTGFAAAVPAPKPRPMAAAAASGATLAS